MLKNDIFLGREKRDTMAKKKKKQKSSIIFLIAAVFLIFTFIYLCTPKIYLKVKEKKYDDNQTQLISSLSISDDIATLITRYAIDNNAYVMVQAADLSVTYETPVIQSVSFTERQTTFLLNDGTLMNLKIQYANNELWDFNRVMSIILPVAGISVILVICLYASLGKSVQKDDFEEFRKATDDMLHLKPKAAISTKDSNRTKNAAATNINELYNMLLMARQSLKTKMNESSILEDQTADALAHISESIDQPINEISQLLNGMIKNEGVYRNHQIYLMEAKMKLDALQDNLKQRLKLGPNSQAVRANHPIDVVECIRENAKIYEVLALEKNIGFRIKCDKPFQTNLNSLLFSKAFNHMMNFILKQCQPKSNIVIWQHDYDIVIAYKGAALTPASIRRVKETDEDIKALFQIIQSIGFFVDFETTQKKDGMQFVFHF